MVLFHSFSLISIFAIGIYLTKMTLALALTCYFKSSVVYMLFGNFIFFTGFGEQKWYNISGISIREQKHLYYFSKIDLFFMLFKNITVKKNENKQCRTVSIWNLYMYIHRDSKFIIF